MPHFDNTPLGLDWHGSTATTDGSNVRTPYRCVDDVDAAVADAVSSGETVIVPPFRVSGIACIAVVVTPRGSHIGLWQPIRAHTDDPTDR